MLSITVRQLEYAVAVARLQGISVAATELNVSQPAISVAISHLEREVGRALFIRRKGRLVVPTSFGKAFIRDAQSVLAGLDRLTDPDARTVPDRATPVAIGCFSDLAPMMLAPALKRFRDGHPAVPVSTRVGDFDFLVDAMRSGRVDFAITYDLGFDESFAHADLLSLPPHAIAAEDHWLAARDTVELCELAKEPLILADEARSVQHVFGLFRRLGIDPRIAHRGASLEMMRSLAANGFGVGIAYTRPRPPQSYDGRGLVTVEIADEAAAEPVVIATHKANPPTRSAQLLIDELAASQ